MYKYLYGTTLYELHLMGYDIIDKEYDKENNIQYFTLNKRNYKNFVFCLSVLSSIINDDESTDVYLTIIPKQFFFLIHNKLSINKIPVLCPIRLNISVNKNGISQTSKKELQCLLKDVNKHYKKYYYYGTIKEFSGKKLVSRFTINKFYKSITKIKPE